jgi:hypothetical protein
LVSTQGVPLGGDRKCKHDRGHNPGEDREATSPRVHDDTEGVPKAVIKPAFSCKASATRATSATVRGTEGAHRTTTSVCYLQRWATNTRVWSDAERFSPPSPATRSSDVNLQRRNLDLQRAIRPTTPKVSLVGNMLHRHRPERVPAMPGGFPFPSPLSAL